LGCKKSQQRRHEQDGIAAANHYMANHQAHSTASCTIHCYRCYLLSTLSIAKQERVAGGGFSYQLAAIDHRTVAEASYLSPAAHVPAGFGRNLIGTPVDTVVLAIEPFRITIGRACEYLQGHTGDRRPTGQVAQVTVAVVVHRFLRSNRFFPRDYPPEIEERVYYDKWAHSTSWVSQSFFHT
jgi:hypothetical protein